MRIVTRICEFNNPSLKSDLDKLSLPHTFDPSIQSIVLEIDENDPGWLIVRELIERYQLSVTTSASFSQKEIDDAKWLVLFSSGHFGYPQPEDSYMQATYDVSAYCETCGMGAVQRNPFRLRSEPKQKKSHFLQLNWVFDEFFVRSEVKNAFEREHISGVEFVNPVLHKNGAPIVSLLQVKIKDTLPAGLVLAGLQPVTCKEGDEESSGSRPGRTFCGRIKYHHPQRGSIAFPRSVLANAPDIVKSNEYFGSGGEAHRLVLISRKTADIIKRHKWRGLLLQPARLV